jgi:hypothetical protein
MEKTIIATKPAPIAVTNMVKSPAVEKAPVPISMENMEIEDIDPDADLEQMP